ncbi:MAG TPA: hypothetical protein VG410_14535 [Solirubrobacteraceae bacterium]|jgi:hypothetical protein|nr:hypothetical protein [Solirubrobacteraceae bacterium]
MRIAVLTIALVFIALLATLTVLDFVNNGVTATGVIAIFILLLFCIGIVGALRHPPQE